MKESFCHPQNYGPLCAINDESIFFWLRVLNTEASDTKSSSYLQLLVPQTHPQRLVAEINLLLVHRSLVLSGVLEAIAISRNGPTFHFRHSCSFRSLSRKMSKRKRFWNQFYKRGECLCLQRLFQNSVSRNTYTTFYIRMKSNVIV